MRQRRSTKTLSGLRRLPAHADRDAGFLGPTRNEFAGKPRVPDPCWRSPLSLALPGLSPDTIDKTGYRRYWRLGRREPFGLTQSMATTKQSLPLAMGMGSRGIPIRGQRRSRPPALRRFFYRGAARWSSIGQWLGRRVWRGAARVSGNLSE